MATVLSAITLLFGASGVFGQLQDSLNTIWEVQPKPGRGLWGFLRDRFLSITMVMGIAFLLLVSLIISSVLSFAGAYAIHWPDRLQTVSQVVNTLVSLAIFTGIFALMFKYLPDVKIAWRDVWLGAVITAVLFTIGKFAIGLYLGRSSMVSSYGVAGSLIVLLVWVYYSAQIVFFGAEFTQVYANRFGKRIVPSENAEPVTEEQRAQQGMKSQIELPGPIEDYFDGCRSRDAVAIAETLADEAIYFDPRAPHGERGPDLLDRIETFLRAVPDVAFNVRSATSIGENETAVRYEMSGTEALTGRTATVSGCDLFVVDGDRIRAIYSYFDPGAFDGTAPGRETFKDAGFSHVAPP